MDREDLIEFEEEIKELFLDGKIKAPVHLAVGSEGPLTDIFKKIKKDDWVFSTHRSQHCSDYTEGLKHILKNVEVIKLTRSKDIFPAYKYALNRKGGKSTLLIEVADLYSNP